MQVQQVSVPGATGVLRGVAYGDPVQMPVLALHGWQDNAASFAPLAPLLEGCYLVALDQAGHGLSDHRPTGAVYHMTDYAADLAHAVQALGWQRFGLLGHSLGAGVAMLYAAAYPEHVEQIILIDGLGPATGQPDEATMRLRKSLDAGLSGADKATVRCRPRVYESWQQLIAARCQASPIGEAAAELLVRRNAIEDEGGIKLRSDRRLRQPSPLYLSEALALHFISQIKAPGLLVMAEDGMVANRERTAARITAFPDLEVVTLPGQHHLHMDTPATVAAAVNEFLRQRTD